MFSDTLASVDVGFCASGVSGQIRSGLDGDTAATIISGAPLPRIRDAIRPSNPKASAISIAKRCKRRSSPHSLGLFACVRQIVLSCAASRPCSCRAADTVPSPRAGSLRQRHCRGLRGRQPFLRLLRMIYMSSPLAASPCTCLPISRGRSAAIFCFRL